MSTVFTRCRHACVCVCDSGTGVERWAGLVWMLAALLSERHVDDDDRDDDEDASLDDERRAGEQRQRHRVQVREHHLPSKRVLCPLSIFSRQSALTLLS